MCVIVMIALYSVFHNIDFREFTLNLSATCMESVLYKGDSISHAVIQGYGICMCASAFFLNGLTFNMLENIEICKYNENIGKSRLAF